MKNRTLEKEERNQMIGERVVKGSIVRVKEDKKTVHIVIIDAKQPLYKGVKIVLTSENYNPDTEILLVKGEDAVYRNPNYKKEVRVLSELITDLQYENFIHSQGGTIVGRVINDETLQRICDNAYHTKPAGNEEICSDEIKHEEITSVAEEIKSEEAVPATEENQPEESVATAKENESVQEKSEREGSGSSALPTENGMMAEQPIADKCIPDEIADEAKVNVQKAPALDFEKLVSESENVESLISALGLEQYDMLKEAVKCAIKTKQGKLKKLLATMHSQNWKLNQNAIRLTMNEDFSEWIAEKNVNMIEFSVSYMLKTIVKGMR